MKTVRLFLLITFLLFYLTGCGNLLYLSKLGWHQSLVTFHSVPVQEVLENEGLDQNTKEKIHLIQEVKRYGEKKLGLTKTESYSKYFEVKGPVLHVITASEKDCLRLYDWNFPITGKVTYKSFFTKEGVLKEKRILEGRGYDIFVQQAGAYSTLGWLKDPIFSSMLQWDEATLANLILHEMTHTSIYFKGQTDLNEQMATFIGNQGAIDFLMEKYGKESQEVVEAIYHQEDDLLFSQWIDEACQQLSNLYAMGISKEEKIRGREEIFQSIQEEFRKLKVHFKTDDYKGFENMSLNNAVLLAYRRYIHRLEIFQALYKYFDNDLRRMIDFFKKIRTSGEEPSTYLERWMKEKGISVPASLQ
jgi:predicted aminopeptidase